MVSFVRPSFTCFEPCSSIFLETPHPKQGPLGPLSQSESLQHRAGKADECWWHHQTHDAAAVRVHQGQPQRASRVVRVVRVVGVAQVVGAGRRRLPGPPRGGVRRSGGSCHARGFHEVGDREGALEINVGRFLHRHVLLIGNQVGRQPKCHVLPSMY